MIVFYLHGFASSAQSSKATYLATRFALHGVTLHVPDLNLPDFSTLTVSRMVDQVTTAVDGQPVEAPVALIGSSLGGFVAVQAARRRPGRVQRLVLLAPALDFDGGNIKRMGESGLAEWKAAGRLSVFHYGYGRMLPVHYELYADATRYDAMNASLLMPILVFQGKHDVSVNPATVVAWARSRPNVELHMLDDDHQLRRSLEVIWERTAEFLQLL